MIFKLLKTQKNTKLDDADLPRVCRFCERATLISDEDNVLCSLKGIVYADYCCRKFTYDPLKREPKMPPPIPKPDLSAIGPQELPPFFSYEPQNAPEAETAAPEPDTVEPEPDAEPSADGERAVDGEPSIDTVGPESRPAESPAEPDTVRSENPSPSQL